MDRSPVTSSFCVGACMPNATGRAHALRALRGALADLVRTDEEARVTETPGRRGHPTHRGRARSAPGTARGAAAPVGCALAAAR